MIDLRDFFRENLESKSKYFYHRKEFRTTRINNAKIMEYSLRFASFLKKIDINKGDKLIIRAKNSPEWVVVFIGCIISGVVIVPLDANSSDDFLERVSKKVSARLLILENEVKGKEIKTIKISDVLELCTDKEPLGYHDIEIDPDDTVEVIFTSGTTSEPKGVVLTYKNIQSNLESAIPVINKWKGILRFAINPKVLSLVPLSHMYGQVVGIFMPLITKMSVVFLDSILPKDILETIRQEKIWVLTSLPKILENLKGYIIYSLGLDNDRFRQKYKRFRKKKWWIRIFAFWPIHMKVGWRLVAIISGGARMDPEVDDFFRCISYGVFQGYGLTETAPLLTLTDPSKNEQGSVGSFLRKDQIRIENGEIYVKGDNVSPGYFKDSQATSKAFKDGWFKTGDLVEIDENGNVFFKGRADDLIVREDGLNIYPEDIENILKKQEDVKDCAVIGIKAQNKDLVIAVILPADKGAQKSDFRQAVDKANSRLNIYQRIDDYYIWPEKDFPRTSTLKVKKSIITKRLLKKEDGEKGSEKEKKDLFSLLSSVKGSNIEKDSEAYLGKDLGLDSLDLVTLSTSLEEEFGIDPDTLLISPDTRVEELKEAIERPPAKKNLLPFYRYAFNPVFIFIRSAFQYLIFPFVRALYRSRVIGKQNLGTLSGPTVFISNHVSIMDSLVILFALPLKIRAKTAVVMSIAHHFSSFFLKEGNIFRRVIEAVGFFLLTALFINVIPLSRSHGFRQVFKNIGRSVDMGWNILIFPEGAVTTDGKMREFEPGIGIISKDMGLEIVPLRIDGLFNILRNGLLPWGHLPRLPVVIVHIGKKTFIKEGDYKEIARKLKVKVREI